MAYKTLIFGVDDLFNELKPHYAREVQRGNLEIVAHALIEGGKVTLVDAAGKPGGCFKFSAGDNFFAQKFLQSNEVFGGARLPAQPNH